MILEIGFNRGSKLFEMKNSARLGIRPGRSDRVARGSNCHGDRGQLAGPLKPRTGPPVGPRGKKREEDGMCRLEGKTEFRPKANIKNRNIFQFLNLFIKANQF
jgi:hypothetical protein